MKMREPTRTGGRNKLFVQVVRRRSDESCRETGLHSVARVVQEELRTSVTVTTKPFSSHPYLQPRLKPLFEEVAVSTWVCSEDSEQFSKSLGNQIKNVFFLSRQFFCEEGYGTHS